MAITFNPVLLELHMLRRKFEYALRERGYRAEVAHPGDPWIFEEVLGIDPTHIVARQGSVTKTTYMVFVTDRYEKKVTDTFGKPVVVRRKFTPEQRLLLVGWWDMLSPEIRAD